MQDLPIRPDFRVAPMAILTEEELKRKANQLHLMNAGERFKIVGSDLWFRLDPTTYNQTDKWRRAYCVNYPFKDITILTQGTHGMSPYLDLPYICYLQGDTQKDPYTIVNRFREKGDTDFPVLDVRNPYKPKRLLREEVKKKCTEEFFVLTTRYGPLKVYIYNTDNILKTAVYIPSMEIVANVFRTTNQHGLELQCIFNVGNSFKYQRNFPIERAGCYVSEPMISLKHGKFTEKGLWSNDSGKWVNRSTDHQPVCNCTFVYP